MKTNRIFWRDLLRQVRLLPLIAFFTALPLPAQIPSLINYQGRLTDGSGNPVTGNRTMAVRIYDAPSGGNMTYEETIGTVEVKNGTYSFQFGDEGDGIIGVLIGFSDYLALSVNGTEESARTRLLAVPYALKAKESADAQAAIEVLVSAGLMTRNFSPAMITVQGGHIASSIRVGRNNCVDITNWEIRGDLSRVERGGGLECVAWIRLGGNRGWFEQSKFGFVRELV